MPAFILLLVVKFCGKLDGVANRGGCFSWGAEKSADGAHSRGKLCKSQPLIREETS